MNEDKPRWVTFSHVGYTFIIMDERDFLQLIGGGKDPADNVWGTERPDDFDTTCRKLGENRDAHPFTPETFQ